MVQDYIDFRHWNYFLSFVVKDGKGGRGLKPENLEPEF